ncbi:hypothetical protein AWH48_03675 [Domibacillus aminovorans]|uniref:Uncharacterized protein n=1 Tax=Domibacillus aminovorans TaxID=29332 RepID=A0A177KRF2_9BACI|nr:hypothetical protein AWH48_03675 [Domibacillus aminovorans]
MQERKAFMKHFTTPNMALTIINENTNGKRKILKSYWKILKQSLAIITTPTMNREKLKITIIIS